MIDYREELIRERLFWFVVNNGHLMSAYKDFIIFGDTELQKDYAELVLQLQSLEYSEAEIRRRIVWKLGE